jgi:hypothetical protein
MSAKFLMLMSLLPLLRILFWPFIVKVKISLECSQFGVYNKSLEDSFETYSSLLLLLSLSGDHLTWLSDLVMLV